MGEYNRGYSSGYRAGKKSTCNRRCEAGNCGHGCTSASLRAQKRCAPGILHSTTTRGKRCIAQGSYYSQHGSIGDRGFPLSAANRGARSRPGTTFGGACKLTRSARSGRCVGRKVRQGARIKHVPLRISLPQPGKRPATSAGERPAPFTPYPWHRHHSTSTSFSPRMTRRAMQSLGGAQPHVA